MNLYTFKDTVCSICGKERLKDTKGPMDKRMKSFFLMADLKDVQQSFYSGTLQNMKCNTVRSQVVFKYARYTPAT
jgi:hypothetical protein